MFGVLCEWKDDIAVITVITTSFDCLFYVGYIFINCTNIIDGFSNFNLVLKVALVQGGREW